MRTSTFSLPFLAVLIGFSALAGCDSVGPEPYESQAVVEAYLVAGERLPDVQLTRTLPITEAFDRERAGIRHADVRIELLSLDETVQATFRYGATETTGVYRPFLGESFHTVQPGRRYRIVIDAPGFGQLTGETLVPTAFTIVSTPGTQVKYQDGDSPPFVLTPNDTDGRQGVYVFTIRVPHPMTQELTPFYAALDRADREDLATRSSPPLNEANYERLPNGNIVVRIPWFTFAFYGINNITFHSIDDAMLRFVNSLSVQQSPGTLSPGEIPNVDSNISGGTGIFGSYSRRAFGLEIVR